MSELKKVRYEPLLKEDLSCWHCGQAMKNMPTLKGHLQDEWDNDMKREKAKLEKKRKREEKSSDHDHLVKKRDQTVVDPDI
jgi:aprataxin